MRSLGTLYAAAVTPLTADDQLDLAGVAPLLQHLADSGCDGAVIAGTTGEGPSLTVKERLALFEEALRVRPPGLRLIAGTGCSALPNTIALTRRAYELGLDGTLVLPPYYFKNPNPAGVREAYRRVIHEAVPVGARVLLYHIPQMSGVALSNDVIEDLQREFPDRLLGIKDSQGDRAHTLDWCRRFRNLAIFVGNDLLLSAALGVGAAGAILASANVYAAVIRPLLDAHRVGEDTADHQARLDAAHASLAGASVPAALKALLAERFQLPAANRPWHVRLPLVLPDAAAQRKLAAAAAAVFAVPPDAPDSPDAAPAASVPANS